jgi:cation diffusion facilitator family transporter
MTESGKRSAEREKRMVALSSVIAAIFLTLMKLTVGLLTRSLGILSEAAHSGLDLLAAGVTLFAVRVSDRPPDREHPYGHGKIENFSALIETVLLLITCAWIIYEAVSRLFLRSVDVEVNYWSFIVMSISIIIDVTRSRALMRAAKAHGSQALEADALHFSTDVWSSSVVIVGLIAVVIGQAIEENNPELASWLIRADAIAALGVSAIVIYVSYRLGRRTISTMLDSAPRGVDASIQKAVSALPGVLAVDRIRSRQSGPATFVDLTLDVARTASLEESHAIAVRAEVAVQQLLPRSDVVVHIEPKPLDDKSLLERIYSVAARQGINIHGLHIQDVRGKLSLEMHTEVPENLSVSQAHERVTELEKAIRTEIPLVNDIVAHIEPVGDKALCTIAVEVPSSDIHEAVAQLPKELAGLKDCHSVNILRNGCDVSVSFHCVMAPSMLISQAHHLTVEVEAVLRRRLPGLGRIIIHVEPPEAS